MDLKVWKQISKDYEIAKNCLWRHDKIKNWHRDEDKGFYQNFFNNLTTLMDSVGKNDNETEVVRLEMLELARSAIQQYATKFKRDGVSKQDIDSLLYDIESVAGKMDTDLDLKKNILNLMSDTKSSVTIDYGTGNGGN